MPCRAELPHLTRLAEKYADEEVALVAILSGRMTGAVTALIEESGAADYVVTDESESAYRAYGVHGVPTTILIDEAGRLMFRHVGFEEGMEEQFEREIEALLAWRSGT
jgi:thiol-disulfide isomerase/thioredoxin